MSRKVPKMGILIIDDEIDIAVSMKNILTLNHHNVYSSTDPYLALEQLRNNSDDYDIVICDVRMPKMSEFEFSRMAKK